MIFFFSPHPPPVFGENSPVRQGNTLHVLKLYFSVYFKTDFFFFLVHLFVWLVWFVSLKSRMFHLVIYGNDSWKSEDPAPCSMTNKHWERFPCNLSSLIQKIKADSIKHIYRKVYRQYSCSGFCLFLNMAGRKQNVPL